MKLLRTLDDRRGDPSIRGILVPTECASESGRSRQRVESELEQEFFRCYIDIGRTGNRAARTRRD